MPVHHPAEEVTADKWTCARCEHDQSAHGTYSDTSSRCYASDEISVINGHPNATACNCPRFTRGHLQVALAVVGTLVVIWAVSGVLAMIR
jgi:hypothetical protein